MTSSADVTTDTSATSAAIARQVVVTRRGGPDVLKVKTRDVAPPPPGQALVRVAAAGVSFGDVLLRVGVIPGGPKPPFTPGYDVTGTVAAVGPGVTDVQPGQRVTALIRNGGYSELVTVPAGRLVPVPAGVEQVDVAAAVLNYFVAYQMLHRIADVRPGQRVLVHGAAGGVGTALLQLARLAGVECYGTSSAAKSLLVAELGGHPIDYRTEDFLAVARANGGVDAVFDPVGGSNFLHSYRALRRGGLLVGYGQSQAMRDGRAHRRTAVAGFLGGLVLPKALPDGKRTTFYHAWILDKKRPRAYREDLTRVLSLLAAGQIRPVVARVLPFADARRAHELLERGAVSGKIVLSTAAGPEPATE